MSKKDECDRYVRFFAYLPQNAPLDPHQARVLLRRGLANMQAIAEYLLWRQCSPFLLREFIVRHWNNAISQPPSNIASRLAQAVMTEINHLADWNERSFALECLARGVSPPIRTLRKICQAIEGRK